MNTPVVLFIQKRPKQTEALFNQIRQIRPKELFIFADGPASEEETELCKQARLLTEFIDWDVTVYRDYSANKLGIAQRILTGLDYVFSVRDRAIILEDDCLPDPTFFSFCEELLEKYLNNNSLMQISGTNIIQSETLHQSAPYFYSKFTLPCWGWATWGRAWKLFNRDYDTWKNHSSTLRLNLTLDFSASWKGSFNSLSMGNRDSWDIQWMIDVWQNKGICIIPTVNLVTNTGVGAGASYMPGESKYANINRSNSTLHSNYLSEVVSFPYEEVLEVENENLLHEFMDYNRKNKPLSLTYQYLDFLQPKSFKQQFNSLYELKEGILPLHNYTVLPRSFYDSCLQTIPSVSVIKEGCWVQAGSWKGGCTAFFKFMMRDLGIKQPLYIYDTFACIPTQGIHHKKDLDFINYFQIGSDIPAYKQHVIKLLNQFELHENVHFKEKDILSLEDSDVPDNIAFACIDVDFFEPTHKMLSLIYPKLIIGGILLIDDYYTDLLNCREAVDQYFEKELDKHEIACEPLNPFTLKITRLK